MGRKGVTGAVAGVGAAAAVGAALADPDRRERLRRTSRVWRLTARRSLHFAAVRVQGRRKTEEERAKLEERFAIRTAEDVARELGNMKGAIMKAGQMISFIAEGLPPEAQAALATLQADVPPMAPSLAEKVIRDELGDEPEKLFLDWQPVPIAAASIGQVHKAVLFDGREVAVKVQYPGVDKAIKSDLDNAQVLYGMASQLASLRNLDVKGIVDELRDRMGDELDYRLEAKNQTEFHQRYRDHPFFRIPAVVPERSSQRVLTSEWVDGISWAEFEQTATWETKQKAAEVLFRFAQGSINGHGIFNGDPHPGNYRFHHDGTVTFLDFGLVKRWTPGELEMMAPVLDAILDRDAAATVKAAEEAGFLARDAGLDPQAVWEYASAPYLGFIEDEFTFTREFVGQALATYLDIAGPYKEVIRNLNMPPSFVILDRVVWGISALLGRLQASGRWGAVLAEYRKGAPPATELGRIEDEWRRSRQPA